MKKMKCYIKGCENVALGYQGKGKRPLNRCEYHQKTYLEWEARRLVEVDRDETDMRILKNMPAVVREKQIQHTHGNKQINNIKARLAEIYER